MTRRAVSIVSVTRDSLFFTGLLVAQVRHYEIVIADRAAARAPGVGETSTGCEEATPRVLAADRQIIGHEIELCRRFAVGHPRVLCPSAEIAVSLRCVVV
jgi:hypothetical protein